MLPDMDHTGAAQAAPSQVAEKLKL